MSWAGRRRAVYIGITFLVALAILGWLGFRVFYTPPTCFDDKQNGDEGGVDCGGSCERVCAFQATPPTVLWSRFFLIAPGVYNAVALIENANVGTEARNVPYEFRFYDVNGILVIPPISGITTIPAEHSFVVFETNIAVGERAPQSSFFEFTEAPEWQRTTEELPTLRTGRVVLSDASTTPRLAASLENPTLSDVQNIEVVAVLYDASGNALGVSRTIVNRLGGGEETPLIFTWPQPFGAPVAKTVLYPRIQEN